MAAIEDASFGTLLRRLRLAANLTQEELAARAGLSPTAISALERGVRRWPYQYTVTRLMTALALPPEQCAQIKALASRQPRPRTRATPAGASEETRSVRQAQQTMAAPPLVGRAHEKAWLERELAGGRPVVLLTGEPGIGKTRLLFEAMDWAQSQGWQVLYGGCQRSSGQEPYAPLVEALERSMRALQPEHLRARLQGCAGIARLLPELAYPNEGQEALLTPPRRAAARP